MKLPSPSGVNTLTTLLCWLLLFCSIHMSARAAELVLNETIENRALMNSAELLWDPSQQLTLPVILREPSHYPFTVDPTFRDSFGYTNSALWLQWTLINPTAQQQSWLLDTGGSRHESLQLYTISEQKATLLHDTGARFPYVQRPLAYPQFVLPFSLPAHSQTKLYLRVASHSSLVLPVHLYDAESFHRQALLQTMWSALFYGAMLGLLLYNLLQVSATREITQAWFVGFCLSGMLTNSGLDGSLYLLWPDAPIWQARVPFVIIIIGAICAIFFAIYFLRLQQLKHCHKWLMTLALPILGLLSWNAFSDSIVAHQMAIYLTVLVVFGLFVLGLIQLRKGNRAARFFCIGWCAFLVSIGLAGLSTLGLLHEFPHAQNWYKMGTLVQVFLLALAVTDRYREWQRKGDEASALAQIALARSQAKSEFLARMSKELKTPAQTIVGIARTLKQTSVEQERLKQFTQLTDTSQFLERMVSDLLDFATLEAGQLTLIDESFHFINTVRATLAPWAMQARQKNLTFSVLIDRNVPDNLTGDALRLNQVLTHLVSNACKFTESGSIKLHVSIVDLNAATVRLRIRIKDSGPGLPEAVLSQLRDDQQANNTVGQANGHGLGLAITQQLVKRMRGTIEAVSEPGKGCELSIELTYTCSAPSTIRVTAPQRILMIADEAGLSPVMAEQQRDVSYRFDVLRYTDVLTAAMQDVALIIAWPEHAAMLADAPLALRHRTLMLHTPGAENIPGFMRVELPWLWADLALNMHSPTISSSFSTMEGQRTSTVLIAEDNHTNQMVIQGMLQRLGLKAEIVSNGIEALQKIRNRGSPYQLVITDIEMPEMDGITTTQKIREWELSRGLNPMTIVALTAHATRETEQRCLEAGMNDFLAKPFTMEQLKQLLKKYVETI